MALPNSAKSKTMAAQMLLSTVYWIRKQQGIGYGAGHIMDVVRGKDTEKVQQKGHDGLSTFGRGAQYSEVQLRGVLRQIGRASCRERVSFLV